MVVLRFNWPAAWKAKAKDLRHAEAISAHAVTVLSRLLDEKKTERDEAQRLRDVWKRRAEDIERRTKENFEEFLKTEAQLGELRRLAAGMLEAHVYAAHDGGWRLSPDAKAKLSAAELALRAHLDSSSGDSLPGSVSETSREGGKDGEG
jgi:hypothetical protein